MRPDHDGRIASIGLAVSTITIAALGFTSLGFGAALVGRSEEHTSELQSQSNLVCRLLLEKKKTTLCPSMHVEQLENGEFRFWMPTYRLSAQYSIVSFTAVTTTLTHK